MARPPIYTERGYELAEVVSALQKAIRRGDEYEAFYWSAEMDRSGYGNYCWRRLRIILSEDVGLGAAPGVTADVWALYQMWQEERKDKKRGPVAGNIHLMHAVLLLVEAQKSQMADNARYYHYSNEAKRIEIPDHALDKHTRRGREMGRGDAHFHEVSGVIFNRHEIESRNPYSIRADPDVRHTMGHNNGPRRFGAQPTLRDKMKGRRASEDDDAPEADPMSTLGLFDGANNE